MFTTGTTVDLAPYIVSIGDKPLNTEVFWRLCCCLCILIVKRKATSVIYEIMETIFMDISQNTCVTYMWILHKPQNAQNWSTFKLHLFTSNIIHVCDRFHKQHRPTYGNMYQELSRSNTNVTVHSMEYANGVTVLFSCGYIISYCGDDIINIVILIRLLH